MVFCDLEGSTALASTMDPEALSRILARWVAEMRRAIELHEGTFVEFRGDSILGVFGIPTLHEDDAVRAVRAALAMRDALAGLNDRLDAETGIRLAIRTGVNTGEVLIGPQAGTGLVVGDPVNVAARLEQAAEAGDILIGEDTARLVRDVVRVAAVPPLTVKGKTEPLTAFRVLEVVDGARPRPGCLMDAALVGRADERVGLSLVADRARSERRCVGALVSGDAGIGKTRLVEEFLTGTDDVTVARGVCRAYGAGALAPAADAVRSLLGLADGEDPHDAAVDLLGRDGAEAHLAHLRLLLGLTDAAAPLEEVFASTRRLIEAGARRRPVVVFVDDLHWAEAPLVDLLEHLLRWSRDAPIVVLGTARPEFLETHPSWVSDRDLAVLDVTLRPLSGVESDLLAESLLGDGSLPRSVRDRVSEASEGNPLFLEQLLAMLIDDGLLVAGPEGGWVVADGSVELAVPPSIHALLGARLDRLDPAERAVIERASIVGRAFSWAAVEALSDERDRPAAGGRLMTLVRRDLIRPDRATPMGGDGFSFHHVLIRDTTYAAIPKAVRAELHERYAAWLGDAAPLTGDLDETLGYHLERACLLRTELGVGDDRTLVLGAKASALLAGAGTRASRRGQDATAVDLLSRALALVPAGEGTSAGILRELAEAEYGVGAFQDAERHARSLSALEGSDPLDRITATVLLANLRFQLDPDGVLEDTRRTGAALLDQVETHGDDRTLAMVYRLLARADLWEGDTLAMADNAERALTLSERCGDEHERAESSVMLCWALHLGPGALDDVVARLGELADASGDDRRVQAVMWAHLAPALALRGEPDRARDVRIRAVAQFRDLGLEVQAAIATQASGGSLFPAVAAGRAREAREDLRWAHDVLDRAEERGFLASITGMLAEAELDAGALDEAERLADACRVLASEDDADAQQRWRLVTAKIHALAGRPDDAVALLRDVESRPSTFPAWIGFVAADRAEILARLGAAEEARERLEDARVCFAAKGITAAVPRIESIEALIET